MSSARAAWLKVYQQEYQALCATAFRMLGPPRTQAEDIVQQAGLRILEMSETQQAEIRQARAFLYQVVCNLARDALRARVTRQRFEAQQASAEHGAETLATPPSSQCDVLAESREQVLRTRQAIARLPPQARAVVLLARVEGLSHQEVGARLGIQAKTVENHLARALKQLHAWLRDEA